MVAARPHTHLSNRAKVRSALEHKPVFRSVLENPFEISWPAVPVNLQNTILARLVAVLENISPRAHASRKILHKTGRPAHQDITEELGCGSISSSMSGASHFVIGINAVTRALELQIRLTRRRIVVDNLQQNNDQMPSPSPIVVVFVCCADVDPTALIGHIPHLVAGCNSPRNATQLIKLVPLPKGSESTISQILGIRRAAAIAFRRESPLSRAIQDVLGSVPIISAPWLCPSDTLDIPQFVPTHIKQLRTTAPKDMRSAREQRAKARAAAKQKVSSSSRPVRRKPRVTLTTVSENAA